MKYVQVFILLIFNTYNVIECSLCPYFVDPELPEHRLNDLMRSINRDFNSVCFFQFKLKKEDDTKIVILIDILSENKLTLTELKRDKNKKIRSRTQKFNFCFVNKIVFLMKRYYEHAKCDIYVFHYSIDASSSPARTLSYQEIGNRYFKDIFKKLNRLGHIITLLPTALKVISEEGSQSIEYFYFFHRYDFIIHLCGDK